MLHDWAFVKNTTRLSYFHNSDFVLGRRVGTSHHNCRWKNSFNEMDSFDVSTFSCCVLLFNQIVSHCLIYVYARWYILLFGRYKTLSASELLTVMMMKQIQLNESKLGLLLSFSTLDDSDENSCLTFLSSLHVMKSKMVTYDNPTLFLIDVEWRLYKGQFGAGASHVHKDSYTYQVSLSKL